jgi:PAS domain S-box-containing protein
VSEGRGDEGSVAHRLVQQSLLHEVWDQAPALVFVADDEMRYAAVNATACEVLGYRRDELLRLKVTDVAVAPEAPGLYVDLLQTGEQRGVTHLRAKDGSLIPFRYAAKEGTVAGLSYYIAVGFVEDAPG